MKINITMSQDVQNAICERCPLAECIGIERRECPIQVEQRATWRKQNQLRKAAGYFTRRAERIRNERTVSR